MLDSSSIEFPSNKPNADGQFTGPFILRNGNKIKKEIANEVKGIFDKVYSILLRSQICDYIQTTLCKQNSAPHRRCLLIKQFYNLLTVKFPFNLEINLVPRALCGIFI